MMRHLRDGLLFFAPIWVLLLFMAHHYGSQETFIGSFDAQELGQQGWNLLQVWKTGDPFPATQYFGVPTPYTYSPSLHTVALPIVALTHLTGNPALAYNLAWALIVSLNGLVTYAFLRQVGLSRSASILGGLLVLWSPPIFGRATLHVYLGQAYLFVGFLYLMWRDKTEGFQYHHWLLWGLLLSLLLGGHEYLGVLGIGLLGFALLSQIRRRGLSKTVLGGSLALGSFVVLSSSVLWLYLMQPRFDKALGIHQERSIEESIYLSASPTNYLLPSVHHPMYQNLVHQNYDECFNYLGLVNIISLLLLLYWRLAQPQRWSKFCEQSPLLRVLGREIFWVMALTVLVTLGPRFKPFPDIPLPIQALISLHLPPFTLIRGWARFGILVSFLACVVSAHLWDYLAPKDKATRRALLACTLALVLFDQYSSGTLTLSKVSRPEALAKIASEPGDFVVLHLPYHSRSDIQHSGRAQVLQVLHGKKIANGYTALPNPAFLDALSKTSMAGLDFVTLKDDVAPEPLLAMFRERDVRYIIYEKRLQFHTPTYTPEHERRHRQVTEQTLRKMEALYLKLVEDSEEYRIYRVQFGP